MHYSQSEKYEIIQLVEQSDFGVNRTLKELKINKTTFYNWYNSYVEKGFEGLARKKSDRVGTWNKINLEDRDKVVEIALEKPELSSREVAWHITDNYNYNENTIIISQGGASAGFINFVTTRFYANAHCYVVLPEVNMVTNRFVFHFLKLNQVKLTEKQHGAGIPALKTGEILKLQIPIPPLPIQEEIVKILDNFTQLEAELEAELEARKKQYEYYRNEMLSFGEEVEMKELGDIGEII